jgi:antirestriction protein
MIEMSIWAGDLGAYNDGELIGDWVDLSTCVDLDDLREKVAEVTRHSEEFHICDYEGPFPVERYTSLDTVWETAEVIGDAHDPDAMAAYLAYHGWDLSTASGFEDAYAGQWDSLEDYALNFFEEIYADTVLPIPGFRIEVDIVAWECDFFTLDAADGGVHVFRNA